MNKSQLWLVLFSIALLFPLPVTAQEGNLRARIRDSIVAREPEWKLQHDVYLPEEMSSLGYHFMVFRWVSGKSAVGAEMYFHNSLANAEKAFKELGEPDTSLSFERVGGERVAGLGDDNYLVKVTHRRGDRYSLVFRKGKTVVQMWADSEALAKQFASYVAAELSAAA